MPIFRFFAILGLGLGVTFAPATAADKDTVAYVQAALAALEYDPGPIDGSWGGKSRTALNAYRATYGLPERDTITASSLYLLHRAQPGEATLPSPGELTEGFSTRSEYLEGNLSVRLRHCNNTLNLPKVQQHWLPVQSFTEGELTGGSGGYVASENDWFSPLSEALMVSSTQCLLNNQDDCRIVWNFVSRFAEEDGLQTPVRKRAGSEEFDGVAWIGNTVLSSLISGAAISASKLDLTMAEKAQVIDWLQDRTDHFNFISTRRTRLGAPNNSRARNHAMAAVLPSMLLGAWIGDRELFNRGRPQFEYALANMREDGSFPTETRRGSRALAYTGLQISYLTAMAEIARAQGEDFYSLASKDGRGLHDAIGFAIRGWRDWEGVVLPYAQENHAAPKTPESPMATAFESYFGWLPAYEKHYPNHRNIWGMKRGTLDPAICSRAHIEDGRSQAWWCRGATPPLTFSQMLHPAGQKIAVASHHMGFNAGCLVATQGTLLGE